MTMKTEKRESLVRLGCVSTDTRGGWGWNIEECCARYFLG